MTTKRLAITSISTDLGTQSRATTDAATVEAYAEAMHEGAEFPPVTVFHDGSRYILADGFHTLLASNKIGYREVDVDVRLGTLRDAILYAAQANAMHGRQRTNADKRHTVTILLKDETWAAWSDREIAKHCAVSHAFVSTCRREMAAVPDAPDSKPRRGADGRVTNTANIGKARKSEPKDEAEERHEPVNDNRDPVAESVERILAAKPSGRDDLGDMDYTRISSSVMKLPLKQLESLSVLVLNLLKVRRTG